MKFCWSKKKVDIMETHEKNTRSADSANKEKLLINAVDNLKKRNEKQLLKVLKLQQKTLGNLIEICKTLMKKINTEKKRNKNANKGEFIDYEEKKKFENMPPIDTESIKTIDWDRLLKKLRK